MSQRDLPNGYVACQYCTWAGPTARLTKHLTAKHPEVVDAYMASINGLEAKAHPKIPVRVRQLKPPKGPNKTEQRYRDTELAGYDARYEALTFHMSNGKRYTPDFVRFEAGKPVSCHEVKGSYRMHSHGRAQLAFAQCKTEFPGLCWIWAEWDSEEKRWRYK